MRVLSANRSFFITFRVTTLRASDGKPYSFACKIREMKSELPLILLVIKDIAERKETENA